MATSLPFMDRVVRYQGWAGRQFAPRAVLVFAALGFYVAFFLALGDRAGDGFESLVVLPVITAALAWGWRAGLAAGALAFPLNGALLAVGGPEGPGSLVGTGAGARHMLVLLVGGGSGQIMELAAELAAQASQRRLAQRSVRREHAARGILAEIGRVVSSSLDVTESFGAFSELVADLVPYDRIMVSSLDLDAQSVTEIYISGDRRIRGGGGRPIPLSGTLAEACAMADETIVVGSGRPWPAISADPWELEGGMASAVCAPLRSRGATTGCLVICSAQPDLYTRDDIAIADQVAGQIGGAVGNMRLHGEINHQLYQRSILAEIGRFMAEATSLDAMLDGLHEALKMTLAFDHFDVATYDRNRDRMLIEKVWGECLPEVAQGAEFPASELPALGGTEAGVCACERGQEIHGPLIALLSAGGMGSWISAPLRARDRLVGLITIASRTNDAYDEGALKMMGELATQVAPSIDNARAREIERNLFSRLEAQNWDLLQARAAMQSAANELEAKNEALQSATDARANFLSMISHELRTPLTIMNGFAEYLSANPEGNLSDQQIQYVGVMQRNGQQLSRLVDDLLSVARMEAGRFQVERTEFDALELVQEIVDDFGAIAAQRGQRVAAEIQAAPARIDADRARLAQVVSNLIGNACKYSDDGAEVRVRSESRGGWFLFEVVDHGIGISDDAIDKIFRSFYRAPELESQNVPGTGLGLVIARSIIEMHGGSISVESEYGSGSTFRFKLPLAGAEPGAVSGSRTGEKQVQAA